VDVPQQNEQQDLNEGALLLMRTLWGYPACYVLQGRSWRPLLAACRAERRNYTSPETQPRQYGLPISVGTEYSLETEPTGGFSRGVCCLKVEQGVHLDSALSWDVEHRHRHRGHFMPHNDIAVAASADATGDA
jgi:hypothetical protein